MKKDRLSEHKDAIHEGKKPFNCGVCGKNFSFKTNWKQHMAVHNGELIWNNLTRKYNTTKSKCKIVKYEIQNGGKRLKTNFESNSKQVEPNKLAQSENIGKAQKDIEPALEDFELAQLLLLD